jgi:hypothetical protein
MGDVVIDELSPDGGDGHEVGVGDVGVRVDLQRYVTGTGQKFVPEKPEKNLMRLRIFP